MQFDDIARMFRHIAEYYRDTHKRMDFVWHGGEPLLLKPDSYYTIRELQHEAFDDFGIEFTNSVQTNLTILNDRIIDLFKHFFHHIGVSIDIFGDQRVTITGKPSQDRVLKNMQQLREVGIIFGCITVLSKQTYRYIEDIYQFFIDIGVSFRLLPIYRTGYEHQQDSLALSEEEIVHALKKAVDMWFTSCSNIQVRPIQDYVVNVIRRLSGGAVQRHFYNKRSSEVVYIVDTDGSLYSNADAYDESLCHGNIFENAMPALRRSEGYMRAVGNAELRMESTCHACKFHGACSGYFMGEATPEQRYVDEYGHVRCAIVEPLQEYIEGLFVQANMVDGDGHLLSAKQLGRELSAPASGAFLG
jgi:uncharacterized protein